MSEMDDMEGRLLSESGDFGPVRPAAEELPPPPRTVETVTLEIRTIQRQAQGILLSCAIEIGRRLEEVKAMLPHGEWGGYLKRELDYSASTAQNFMKVFREYGADQQSLFGGVAKSQTLGNLSYSKALRLLAIPDEEERESFVKEHDVANMSTRELEKAIKERDEAEEKAVAAQDEARKIRREADRLQEQLANQDRTYKAKLTAADVETTEANRKAREAQEALDKQRDKAQRLQEALSAANNAAQAAGEEQARLARELEELRNRPVDVAVEADQEAIARAREEAIAEMTEKVDKANKAAKEAKAVRKDAEAALAAARKELEELKARGAEVRELTEGEKAALIAEEVERARGEDARRVRELEKQLAVSDKDSATFKALFETWQRTGWDMMEALKRISDTDVEKAEKLKEAVRAVTERLIGTGI